MTKRFRWCTSASGGARGYLCEACPRYKIGWAILLDIFTTMKNIFISTFCLLTLTAFGQTGSKLRYKTLKDSTFAKGDIIKIPELIFDLSYPIRPETIDSLELVSAFLKNNPTLIVEVGCHTDLRGSIELNNRISEFRAYHVREVLVRREGIDSSRVTYKGYGETAPIVSERAIQEAKTKEEKEKLSAINGRTELLVIDTK